MHLWCISVHFASMVDKLLLKVSFIFDTIRVPNVTLA